MSLRKLSNQFSKAEAIKIQISSHETAAIERLRTRTRAEQSPNVHRSLRIAPRSPGAGVRLLCRWRSSEERGVRRPGVARSQSRRNSIYLGANLTCPRS